MNNKETVEETLTCVVRQKAVYHEEEGAFKGNPFVEALPRRKTGKAEIETSAMDVYEFSEAQKQMTDEQREEELLERNRTVFYPLRWYERLNRSIETLIRDTYRTYLPESYVKDENVAIRDIKKHNRRGIPAPACLVTGFPGVGKSTAIRNILLDYPDVIDHGGADWCNGDPKQIPVIQIQCPPPRSYKKGIWTRILQEIDRLIGLPSSNYDRISAEILRGMVEKRLRTYKVGLLIIEEVGKLLYADSKTVDDYLTDLYNSISCSLLLVGNATAHGLYDRELYSSRRTGSFGELECYNIPEESPYWKRYSTAIWNALQITRTKTPLDEPMRHMMYEACGGFPFLFNELYIEMQKLAMKDKPDERITEKHLRQAVQSTKKRITEKVDKIRKASAFDVLCIPDVFDGRVEINRLKKPEPEKAAEDQLTRKELVRKVKKLYQDYGYSKRYLADDLEAIAADYISLSNLKQPQPDLMKGAVAYIEDQIVLDDESLPEVDVSDINPLDHVYSKEQQYGT